MHRLIPTLIAASLLAVAPAAAFAQTGIQTPQPQWRQAREERVDVALGRITPGVIRLRAGEPTRIVFYNSSPIRLGIRAGRFFAASQVRSGDADLIMHGGFAIRQGEQRVVDLVPVAGRYRLRSASLFRRLIGMSAQIIVE